jgi:hypothetical protein
MIEKLARSALLASCVATALASMAAPVSASRVPSPSEASGIRYAIAHDPRTCCGRGRYRVVHIRVSSVDRSFATATVDPSSKAYQGADVLLWRGTKRWAVIDAGTDFLGCDYVTAAVRKDLFGTTVCP